MRAVRPAISAKEVLEILRHSVLVPSIPSENDPRWEQLRPGLERSVYLDDGHRGALIGGARASCHVGHLTERCVTEVRGPSRETSLGLPTGKSAESSGMPATTALRSPPTADVGKCLASGIERLQVVRGETGVLGDAGQHAGVDLFAIVEGEDEVRPVGVGENPMGAGDVALHAPANSEKRRQAWRAFREGHWVMRRRRKQYRSPGRPRHAPGVPR